MPIRDTLQRLTGEGLVDNFQNEGFRVVQLDEPAIRDRYAWCRDLVRLCLAHADQRNDPLSEHASGSGYADELTRILLRIAGLSSNHEHRRAMANLCERSFQLRAIEERLIDSSVSDLTLMTNALDSRDWRKASHLFESLHRRSLEMVPSIIANLRDRTGAGRPNIF